VVSCWDCWVGSSWVLSFVFCWATYVYFLMYLEVHCAFFVYTLLLIKKKKKKICLFAHGNTSLLDTSESFELAISYMI
jgi:hypothetical protein